MAAKTFLVAPLGIFGEAEDSLEPGPLPYLQAIRRPLFDLVQAMYLTPFQIMAVKWPVVPLAPVVQPGIGPHWPTSLYHMSTAFLAIAWEPQYKFSPAGPPSAAVFE